MSTNNRNLDGKLSCSGNASLLAQLKEIQEIKDEYGNEATEVFVAKSIERSTGETFTRENANGLLRGIAYMQQKDINVGYVVKETSTKVDNILLNIMSENSTQHHELESDEDNEFSSTEINDLYINIINFISLN